MEYRDDAAITEAKLLALADACHAEAARIEASERPPVNLWPRDLPAPGPATFAVSGGALWVAAASVALVLAASPDDGRALWKYGGWGVAALSLASLRFAGGYRAVLAPLSLASISPLLVLRPLHAVRKFFADGHEHYLGPAGMFSILSPIVAAIIVLPATVYGPRLVRPEAVRADELGRELEDLAANVPPKAPASLSASLRRASASLAALRDAVAREEAERAHPLRAKVCHAVAIAAVVPVAFVVFAYRRAWGRATRTDAYMVLAASVLSLAYVLVVAVIAWRRRPPGSRNS